MGNEDAIVCKEKFDASKNCDCAAIESLKLDLEKTSLADERNGEDHKKLDFVQILPVELIEEIFIYLNPKDLAACTAVSSSWREAVNSNKIWNFICEKRGWKDNFDLNTTHFYKSHRQFRKWSHSYDSFTPICQKRLLFNQHSCLQDNWRCGKYIKHKISGGANSWFDVLEPITCDGKYLVLLEKKVNKSSNLGVWSLEGVPFKLCDLTLPDKVNDVETIAFDFDTIVIIQDWVIRVFHFNLYKNTFEEAFVKYELSDLIPTKKQLLKDAKKCSPYLKVTQEYIIFVPSFSHSTEEYVPIFFWDRKTGDLKHTLQFDSMYQKITSAIWFGDSCYLGLSNKKKKAHQIVEFSVKTAAWEAFSQSVIMEIEQIAVSNQYILAVTKKLPSPGGGRRYFSTRGEERKEIWLWDRATGSALKSFDAQGKGFQFVGDCLMFYDSAGVTVMNPKTPDIRSEFEINGTVVAIRGCCHSNLMLIMKSSCHMEIWDWSLGCRLYTINGETGLSSHLWCDSKRIITHLSPDTSSGGVIILGFW
uniref:F-box domain-containing protein n=1 Tax=Cuerna arida TaxID=1464854 RepID=A0A1B6EUN8_9HEMI